MMSVMSRSCFGFVTAVSQRCFGDVSVSHFTPGSGCTFFVRLLFIHELFSFRFVTYVFVVTLD